MLRCDVLSPNLDDTGTSAFSLSEQNTEIQIMGENHSLILPRPLKDLIIGSGGTAYVGPCSASIPFCRKSRTHSGDKFMSTRSFTPNQ